MKTYPSEIRHSEFLANFIPPLSGVLRVAMAVVCATLVSLLAPSAQAGAADGEYAFVSASGYLTGGGDTIELPQDVLQEIGPIQDGHMVIKNNKMQLNRKAATRIIKGIGKELGIEFETTLTGPSSLKLNKSGKVWIGSTSEPIVVTFAATVEGEEISGNLKTHFQAKLKGDKLTIKVPITGRLSGKKISGEVNIVCER